MGTSLPQHDAEEQEQDFRATAIEWKAFIRSNAWKDLKLYMECALEDAKDMLSVTLEERAIVETDDSLRGGIKMLRRMLAFPAEQLEEKENDIGRDEADASGTVV